MTAKSPDKGHPASNLPIELTSFIGRDKERMEVKRLLASTRLLTLTGAGGAGKTRLALQVASEALEQFTDGVWLVELGPLFDASLVPRTVASALGVPEQPGRPILATLTDYLRDRQLLLVLDNCEHLIGASAELAEALLRVCPGLRILATSREALGITGETSWRVPSLSTPGPEDPPSVGRLREYEAVQLFESRAALGHPEFRITANNAALVALICRRLDGMPLAIELAAARLKVLTAEQLAAKLDDRFRLLTGGSRTALPRQQTLRATMDWSYDLLPDAERMLLRRLSVFAGGWTLEAAEAICSGGGIESSDVLDLLTHLVDKSIVITERQGGAARYRLLETVRQYAQDRLVESGDAADVRRRHRDWYLALAERGRTLAEAFVQRWEPEELERFERDHDNLRAAIEWSATEKAGAEPGLRLVGALWSFWVNRGYYAEGRRWLEGALARSHEAPPAARAEALQGAAALAWRQADYGRATQLAEALVALGRAQADKAATAAGLTRLGMVVLRSDQDFPRARALFEEALALAKAHGSRAQVGVILAQLGETARQQKDYDRAGALLEESVGVIRAASVSGLIVIPLRLLGHVRLEQGDVERAAALYIDSLRTRAVSSFVSIECLEGLAGVALGRGQHQRAARLFGAVDARRESLGFPRSRLERDHYERRVAAVRASLGDGAFLTAAAEGRAMALDEAVEYALGGSGAAAVSGERAREQAAKDQGPLTTREREVAALVARGLTNREIAAKLVISERTADAHVQHILNKLGFGSRAQIAAWAVEQGLPAAASDSGQPR